MESSTLLNLIHIIVIITRLHYNFQKRITMGMIYPEQLEYMDVEQMQQTHENEIAMLNEIDNLAIEYEIHKSDPAELERKLDAYMAHVKEHFANEERLMEQYGFPSYEMHKTAHDMFLADLEYAAQQWKEYGNLKKMLYFIRKTPEWIVMHVNSVDAPTAQYLAAKMAQQ